MRQSFYAIGLCAAGLCMSACGTQSAASLDCEEYERLMQHLTTQAGAPLAATQIANCEQRLVKASTRCQSAFRALAECSRAHHSRPPMHRGACASELVEQQTLCNKAPAS